MAPDAGPPPAPPPMPPPVPPGMPPPGAPGPDRERRRLAWVLGGVAEAVLLWWLVQMAWTDSVDEPALSVGDGLVLIGIFGGIATACIVGAAAAYATGRPRAGTVAAVALGVVAAVVGFVGGLLTALARVDSGEH